MDTGRRTHDGHEYATTGGLNRRDLIRRGAVIGGAAAWTLPTVQTIGMRAAFAGTPQPDCCTADAYGLRVAIHPLGFDETFPAGQPCLADTGTLGAAGTATVEATIVCAGTTVEPNGPCVGKASIATLDVVVGPTLLPTLTVSARTLTSETTADCAACHTTGTSTIQSLTVNGINVDVTAACNLDALGLGTVFVNRQECDGDTLNVDALHIHVPGILTVTAAHSEASADGCPCQACS